MVLPSSQHRGWHGNGALQKLGLGPALGRVNSLPH